MSKHFLAACLAQPWAMDPAFMKSYSEILVRGYRAHDARNAAARAIAAFDDDEIGGGRDPYAAAAPKKVGGSAGAIAVISIRGALVSHASDLGPCDGGMSYDMVQSAFRAAVADESVGQILMLIDSPGGSVFGCMELADEIRASSKPVTALASYCAASAAYWLGTAASDFWVAPSGQVGSIGVWMAHQDVTGAMEQEGVKMTLISAGKYKVEGNPFEPLGDDARAHMQASVDEFYSQFVRAVAKGRSASVDDVRTKMGEGRMLSAADAKAANMVDNVGTFDECVAAMQRKARRSGAARAQAAVAVAAA